LPSGSFPLDVHRRDEYGPRYKHVYNALDGPRAGLWVPLLADLEGVSEHFVPLVLQAKMSLIHQMRRVLGMVSQLYSSVPENPADYPNVDRGSASVGILKVFYVATVCFRQF
jgi:hypothetical protein